MLSKTETYSKTQFEERSRKNSSKASKQWLRNRESFSFFKRRAVIPRHGNPFEGAPAQRK